MHTEPTDAFVVELIETLLPPHPVGAVTTTGTETEAFAARKRLLPVVPAETDMVVLPGDTAVMIPLAETVAILGAPLEKLITAAGAPAGCCTVGVSESD